MWVVEGEEVRDKDELDDMGIGDGNVCVVEPVINERTEVGVNVNVNIVIDMVEWEVDNEKEADDNGTGAVVRPDEVVSAVVSGADVKEAEPEMEIPETDEGREEGEGGTSEEEVRVGYEDGGKLVPILVPVFPLMLELSVSKLEEVGLRVKWDQMSTEGPHKKDEQDLMYLGVGALSALEGLVYCIYWFPTSDEVMLDDAVGDLGGGGVPEPGMDDRLDDDGSEADWEGSVGTRSEDKGSRAAGVSIGGDGSALDECPLPKSDWTAAMVTVKLRVADASMSMWWRACTINR